MNNTAPSSSVDFIILAGKSNPADPDFMFGGKRAIDITIEAIKMFAEIKNVGRIITVGVQIEGCIFAESGQDMAESLQNGLPKVRADYVYVLVSDLPFITTTELMEFFEKADPFRLNIAVVTADACAKAYPKLKRTTMNLLDGRFTMGGAAFGPRSAFRKAVPVARKAYKARKSKLKLAVILGPAIAIRYGLSKKYPKLLSIVQLEDRVTKLIGHSAKGVVGSWPGLGTDVDDAVQYEIAKTYF